MLIIEADERFLLLKLMNGLYGVSLADNAVNTQALLSKIILFLKYYASDEYRLVKLKDELAMIGLFGEIMTAGTGNSHDITVSMQDNEAKNLNIPSKSLLSLALEMLVFQNKVTADRIEMTAEVCRIEQALVISFAGNLVSDADRIKKRAHEVQKAFEDVFGRVGIELDRNERDLLRIRFTLADLSGM